MLIEKSGKKELVVKETKRRSEFATLNLREIDQKNENRIISFLKEKLQDENHRKQNSGNIKLSPHLNQNNELRRLKTSNFVRVSLFSPARSERSKIETSNKANLTPFHKVKESNINKSKYSIRKSLVITPSTRPSVNSKFKVKEAKLKDDDIKLYSNELNNSRMKIHSHNSITSLLANSIKEAKSKASKVREQIDCARNYGKENTDLIENERLESQENLLSNIKGKNTEIKFKSIKHDSRISTKQKNIASIETEEDMNWDELINTDFQSINTGFNYYFSRSLRRTVLVYDSLSDNEEDDKDESTTSSYFDNLIFDPNSKLIHFLKLVVCLSLFVYLFYYPLYLGFTQVEYLTTIENIVGLAIDLILIIELILNFFTGFYENEEVNLKLKHISKNYLLNGTFVLDLVSALPYFVAIRIMLYFEQNQRICEIDHLYKGAILDICLKGRWLRMLSIFKFWKLIDAQLVFFRIEEHSTKIKKILLIKAIIFFFLTFHIISCVWIHIGILNQSSSSWIHFHGLAGTPDYFIYVSSLYYNMATILSIGYGDIYPISVNEKLYVCFLMLISTQIYSLIISWISSVIYDISKKDELFSRNKEILKDIIAEHKIAKPLEKQLKLSLSFIEKNYVKDKHYLLDSLPDRLKNFLYKKIYENRIGELYFFKGTSEEFKMHCTPRIQSVILKKGEVLISKGDIFTELYMVNKGTLNFYLGSIFNNYRINSIGSGYHFGDVNMYLNESSEYTIKSARHSTEIFTLKKSFYSELKINFPDIVESIIKKSIDNFANLEMLRKSACDYFDKNGNMSGFRIEAISKLYDIQIKELNNDERNNISSQYLHHNLIGIRELSELLDENTLNSFKTIQPKTEEQFNLKKNNDLPLNKRLLKQMSVFDLHSKPESNNKPCLKKSSLPGLHKFPYKSSCNSKSNSCKSIKSIHQREKKMFLEDSRNRQLFRKINLETLDIQQCFGKKNKAIRLQFEFKEDQSNYYIFLLHTSKSSHHHDQSTFNNYSNNSIKDINSISNQNISLVDIIKDNSFRKLSQSEEKGFGSTLGYQNESVTPLTVTKILTPFSKENGPCYPNTTLKINCKRFLTIKRSVRPKQSKKSINIDIENKKDDAENSSQNAQNEKSRKLNRFKTQIIESKPQQAATKDWMPNTTSVELMKQNFLDMNKQEMMKDFGRRIDKNAFYENNMNLYENYLKNLIKSKKGAASSKQDPPSTKKSSNNFLSKLLISSNYKRSNLSKPSVIQPSIDLSNDNK